MQTLATQVFEFVGEETAGHLGLTATKLTNWATDARRRLVSYIPERKLDLFTSQATIGTSGGLALKTGRFKNVFRNDGSRDQPARAIPPSAAGRAQDPEDAGYLTQTDPGYYMQDSVLFILPVPSRAGSELGKVSRVNVATLSSASSYPIAGIPGDVQPLLVKDMLMSAKLREAGYARVKMQDELKTIFQNATDGYLASFIKLRPSLTLPSVPALPTVPSFTNATLFALPTYTTATVPAFNKPADLALSFTALTESQSVVASLLGDFGTRENLSVASLLDRDTEFPWEQAKILNNTGNVWLNRAQINIDQEAKKIDDYVASIQLELGRYNGRIESYQSSVEAWRKQSEIVLASYKALQDPRLAEYSNDIQNFAAQSQATIAKYAANVQAVVAEGQHELAKNRVFLEAAAVRTKTVDAYFNQGAAAMGELSVLRQEYREDLAGWLNA